MAGRIDAGKAFIDELLTRIPEDQRAAVQAGLEAAGEDVYAFAGDGALRLQDYSRNLNGVKATEKQQTEWWEANQALVAAAKAAGIDPTKPAPVVRDTVGLSREDISKLIDEREAGVGNFVGHTLRLGLSHFKEFGEELDVPKLMQDPQLKELGLLGVYEKTYGPKIAEKKAAAAEAATEAEVQRRVAEARRADANKPLHLRDPGLAGSPLDALTDGTPGGSDPVVDEATAFYENLRAQRYSAGGGGA